MTKYQSLVALAFITFCITVKAHQNLEQCKFGSGSSALNNNALTKDPNVYKGSDGKPIACLDPDKENKDCVMVKMGTCGKMGGQVVH